MADGPGGWPLLAQKGVTFMAKNNNFLSGDHWDLLKIRRIFKKVNKLAPAMRKLSDEELKAKTGI